MCRITDGILHKILLIFYWYAANFKMALAAFVIPSCPFILFDAAWTLVFMEGSERVDRMAVARLDSVKLVA